MSEGTMRNIMYNAIKKAGLQPPRKGMPLDRNTRSLHGLRYTFAVQSRPRFSKWLSKMEFFSWIRATGHH